MKKLGTLALAASSLFFACSDDSTTSPATPQTPDHAVVSSMSMPGLSAPVRLEYDEFGFAHLHGQTDADVFAALGYVHAQNRFFFMDFVRRSVRGTLGELLLAPGVVDQDVTSRTFFATRNGDPLAERLVEQLDDMTRSQFVAYASGVNAWLADVRAERNGATLTEEYNLPNVQPGLLTDWEPADSAAIALFVLSNLSNNSSYEATLGQAAVTMQTLAPTQPKLATTLEQIFFDFRPTFNAFTLPSANEAAPTTTSLRLPTMVHASGSLFGAAADRLASLRPLDHGPVLDHGSNNWVLSGSRTVDGRPLLENDPHLSLSNPSIWFPAEIDAKSKGGTGNYHVAGGTFPGLPAVFTGHNEKVAWGVTVTYWDLADLYIEQLTKGGTAVSFNGTDVDIVTKSIEFSDQGKKVTRTLAWVPHHGPILSLNAAAGQATTVRWTAFDGSTDAQAFMEVGRANSVAEVKQALTHITVAAQNFVVADTDGTIGWYPYAVVPSRPWVKDDDQTTWPVFPQPGNGTREWDTSPVPLDALPQATNPAHGAIFTANEDLTGATADGNPFNDGHLATQAADMAEGTRAEQIRRELDAGGNMHSLDTIHALQSNTKSLLGERIAPRLVEAAGRASNLDPATQAVVAALGSWAEGGTFTCPSGINGSKPSDPKVTNSAILRDSAGCMAFHVTLYALFEAAFGDEQSLLRSLGAPSFGVQNEVKVLMRSFANAQPDPTEAFWDDVRTNDTVETRDDMVMAALSKAGGLLQEGRGGRDRWQWGAIHTLTLQSPLSSATSLFNSDPYATPGGLFTVNVANPADVNLHRGTALESLNFGQTSGPSIRTLIHLDTDRPHMMMGFPGGSDLHRSSPFYNNMVPRWTSGQVVEFAFGAGAIPHPAVAIDLVPSAP